MLLFSKNCAIKDKNKESEKDKWFNCGRLLHAVLVRSVRNGPNGRRT